MTADLHLHRQNAGGGDEGSGFVRVVRPDKRDWKRAMTLDQLRLSVDEVRSRINDKIGDVLDDDSVCTSEQGRGALIDALKSLSIQAHRLLDLLKEED